MLANELLRLLEAGYGANVAHLRRIFLIFPFPYVIVLREWRGSYTSLLLLILFNLHQMYLLGLDGSLLRAGYARLPHPCAG